MFSGSMVALVTPMNADGAIAVEALQSLIRFHIEAGTHALVIAGTTGESATLERDEHAALIRAAVKAADGRLPVIAGTGSNSTAQTVELSRAVQDSGAAALLLVTPYYNKPTQEGLYRHFMAVRAAVELPLILYNVPGRTGCDLLPETVARLAVDPGFIGIKDATADIERAREILRRCRAGFELYSGDDATALELMRNGARGVISVSANVAPGPMRRMCEAALAGDWPVAAEIDAGLAELHAALFIESNPIPAKWALHEMDLIPPGIRLPLTPLAESCRPALRAAMRAAGAGGAS